MNKTLTQIEDVMKGDRIDAHFWVEHKDGTIYDPKFEEYNIIKQRRADKQYHKEQAKSKTGKITPEQRRSIKINKLKQKQTEARSKGTASYGVGWSLASGVQEGVEPKADRLQRRIDKLEDKKPSSKLSKTKARTKAMKASRKAKKSKK